MPEPYRGRPHHVPPPTYWPFFLALGVVLLFWGILTTWFISGMGAVVFAVALGGWISDLLKAYEPDEKEI